ncbi:MAG: NAD(P)/FAD-dependent oxidoreductase [Candidatus Omnitrophica bacterium]|nr:NAD(P)/FAD-dependent oxidoreductase [Candidatus Omnitrophota bacterium]
MDKCYDVIIIGAGVVGSAVAREMSRYKGSVLLLEKEHDVACGASGANSGVIHAGFNVPTGSLKARFNVKGAKLLRTIAEELDVPMKFTGKLVVALKGPELAQLKHLKAQGEANGVRGLKIISKDELRRLEPNIEGIAALHSPNSGIICPFTLNIALAENALSNGVDIRLNTEVTRISKREDHFRVFTKKGTFRGRYVINSAGLMADKIAAMVGLKYFRVQPCRGEYFVLDRASSGLLKRMVYPVPPVRGNVLGVHLTPTIDGNILIGPSAELIHDKYDTRTTGPGLGRLLKEAKLLLPALKSPEIITSFSGIRPKLARPTYRGCYDFIVKDEPQVRGFINLAGIESPGLTAAVAIAREIALSLKKKLALKKNGSFKYRREGIVRVRELPLEERASLIRKRKEYGELLCRCEEISKAEIIDALNNPLGVRSMRGIKIRTRAMMGRCQGGFCGPNIIDLLQRKGIDPDEINLRGKNSCMLTGKTK